MDTSARLGLPYLAPAQLQKHVTLNEALTRLDVLVQCTAVSRTVTAQPPDPADGDLFILPDSAAGSRWSGYPPGALVRFEAGGWAVQPVAEGVLVWIVDEATAVVRHDGGWLAWGETLGAVQNLDRLGLNTTADAANPFAARLNTALWTARNVADGGDGDLRMTFNKEAASDVGSLLFQSGYSGRAELGLVGDDDLTLKVSADGAAWRAAMVVDRTTGAVAFPAGGGRAETFIVSTSGPWTPPAWARRLDILAVGAGGGGGSGAVGASGARFGGGGGGAGGVATASWPTADLTSALSIVIGAAGPAGVSGVPGVSGVEFSGGSGGSTTLSTSGHVLLTAPGGFGGQGGDALSGLGGAGGAGIPTSNGGGDSRVAAAALPGASLQRPDASGGGGAGGGLDASDVARNGGPGGAGGTLTRLMTGGTGGSGAPGGSGAMSPAPALSWAGGGGGGGGASLTTGHAGGAGAVGAGGGGGGAGVSASGAGSLGGAGFVRIVAVG